MNESDKIHIRVELEDALAKKFLKLKELWGLQQNTETIRAIISKMYESEGLEFIKD